MNVEWPPAVLSLLIQTSHSNVPSFSGQLTAQVLGGHGKGGKAGGIKVFCPVLQVQSDS